jgi:hypothetical protein
MKPLLTVLSLYALVGSASAGLDPLVGSFTHDFTRVKNDAVWTVKKPAVHGRSVSTVRTKLSVLDRLPKRRGQHSGTKCGGLLIKQVIHGACASKSSLRG